MSELGAALNQRPATLLVQAGRSEASVHALDSCLSLMRDIQWQLIERIEPNLE